MARPRATRDVVLALHKPYGVLSQFTPDGSANRPLKDLGLPGDVWPVGRLDADSEGLLLLASSPALSHRLLDPERGHPREYWVQVERVPDDEALRKLAQGVVIQGRRTRPCRAWRIDEPSLPPRDPPVRFRKSVPTAWIALELTEGRNRQVRRMTAAVGHPTLRLVRARIGGLWLDGLTPEGASPAAVSPAAPSTRAPSPGTWRALSRDEIQSLLAPTPEERVR